MIPKAECDIVRGSEKEFIELQKQAQVHKNSGERNMCGFTESDQSIEAHEDSARDQSTITFISRMASDIRTRAVNWLWPGVVPFSMTSVIMGDPGEGKTYVAADIAARTSKGMGLPEYCKDRPYIPILGKVVYVTSEGVPDKILVPRLIAAGADLGRIEIIEGISGDNNEDKILDINEHLPFLAQKIKADQEIKLVIIDPLASHLNQKTNTASMTEMRAAMDKISRFSEDTSCAVIVIVHLNKDDRKAVIHRISGSVQIMAAVKSAWAVVRKHDDDNENRRYFSPVKSNLAPFRRSLSFEIKDKLLELDDGSRSAIGRIEWSREPEEFDLQRAISPGSCEIKSKVNEAVSFLRDRLADGPQPARILYAEAEGKGIPKNRLWTAKQKEGIEDGREGFRGQSIWHYPMNMGKDAQ